MEKICKEDFQGIYPVSCVESYTLAYLKSCGFPISLLYYESYLSVNHIMHDFLTKNSTFTQYDAIKRIQDIAIDLGVLDLYGVNSSQFPDINSLDKEILIEIGKERFLEMYGKNTWRDDHFFYTKMIDNNQYYYLNNNPLHSMITDYDFLTNIYKGTYILFRYISNEVNKPKLLSEFIRRYDDESKFEFTFCVEDATNLEDIRNAIGILKIVRHRVCSFLEEIGVYGLDFTKTAEELYAQLEYMRIRNRYDPNILADKLPVLNQEEYEIKSFISKLRC